MTGKRVHRSREFKAEAVKMLEQGGSRQVSEIAGELGVRPTQLHTWKRELDAEKSSERNAAGGAGSQTPEKRGQGASARKRDP